MLSIPLSPFTYTVLAVVVLSLAPYHLAANEYRPFYATPAADAPELAHRGNYSVGVQTLELVNPDQIDIFQVDLETMAAPRGDRRLQLQLWYPAKTVAGRLEETTYRGAFPPHIADIYKVDYHYAVRGKAVSDAAPVDRGSFPLVIISHGFNGTYTFLSYLAENLASKGYIVAAIDHRDYDTALTLPTRVRFASTLLNRTRDQLFSIEQLPRWAKRQRPGLHRILDPSRVAIIGYSMGGFGAIGSAGAGLNKDGQTYKSMPGGHLDSLLHGSREFTRLRNGNIKAVVALAPWGAQAPFRSWQPAALRDISTPILFIAGDHDDVSAYEDGIKWLFEHSINSDRYLLVYQNARHNTGGNPAPPEAGGHFQLLEYYNEPVWRKNRITAINQHFVTAFLDWHLRGDRSRRAYFGVDNPQSAAGRWPQQPGQQAGDRYSGGRADDTNTYWKGFQRRWALGLELHHLAPGEGKKN